MKSTCLITLTYNRPSYIERSFESVYKKAGVEFDHYVFDDCSDEETSALLRELSKKYDFKLFRNEKNVGIYRNFMMAINQLPASYKYYVKLDSDIEFLSDNFLADLLEVFDFKDKVSCVTSRLEGVDISPYKDRIDFFAGHAVRINQGIKYGCCMVFPARVFNSFKRMSDIEIKGLPHEYGIDSELYSHAMKNGDVVVVSDVSMYHIDNVYGQRRLNPDYFTSRNRWNIIDTDEVWYMLASKEVAPAFISRQHLESLRRLLSYMEDQSLESYVALCKKFAKYDVSFADESAVFKNGDNGARMKLKVNKKYLISNPHNFRSTPHMARGSSMLVDKIPDWAINNSAVVIEKVDVNEEVELDENLNVKSGKIKTFGDDEDVKIVPDLEVDSKDDGMGDDFVRKILLGEV